MVGKVGVVLVTEMVMLVREIRNVSEKEGWVGVWTL